MADTDRDQELKDQFIARYGSQMQDEPSLLKAIGQPNAELEAALSRAHESAAFTPGPVFDPAERDRYGGKRNPQVARALMLFARGMALCPDATRGTGISPALIEKAASRDRAACRLIDVAEMFVGGGDNGALLVSALLGQLTDRVLAEARARLLDPALSAPDRACTNAAFAEVFRNQGDRAPGGATSLSHATAGERQKLAQTKTQAEEARLMDAYRSFVTDTGSRR